jgi:hypothetical protein
MFAEMPLDNRRVNPFEGSVSLGRRRHHDPLETM